MVRMKTIVQNIEQIHKKALEDLERYERDLKNPKIDPDLVARLKKAKPQYKKANPVMLSPSGKIIDGVNRLKADPNWDYVVMEETSKGEILSRFEMEHAKKDTFFKQQSLRDTIDRLIGYYRHTEQGQKEYEEWKEKQPESEAWKRKTAFIVKKIAQDLDVHESYVRKFFPKELKEAQMIRDKKPNCDTTVSQFPSQQPSDEPKPEPLAEKPQETKPEDYEIDCPRCGTTLNKETGEPLVVRDNNIPKAKSEAPKKCVCDNPIRDANGLCEWCRLPMK